ncbi:unnamed protein product [Adineta steineri]|uniref:Uncharacterized protein n=2 Tax=Adineta steineri TaxID=433720 RepID=A0A815M3S9_9BILA|nr:unnamed protein product [Adineta steineri]
MNHNHHNNYFIQNYTKSSPHHQCYYSSFLYDNLPRRNSYKMAIHTSKHDHLQILCSSSTSSVSSINDRINTTRSLYTIHNGCSYCINDHIQRSISQPTVHVPDNDFLLENATFLLDSPVHALRPAHHKSRVTLSPTKPLSTRSSLTVNDPLTENDDYLNSTIISVASIYRIVFLRSFASVFALASLFTIEVLQTSIYSVETSFQSLLTLHLSSSITAFIFAAHVSHIQMTHYHWKMSSVLTYDHCSQIAIICATIFTSTWIIIQYFHSFYYLLLISAGISGISLSCMIIKTYDHLLQLSTSLLMENMKILTIRFNIFMFIYNCICHLSLSIGGICFLAIVLFQQWKNEYIFVGFPSCVLLPCLQLTKKQDDNTYVLTSLKKSIPINFTMYLTDAKQVWIYESTRYYFIIILIFLTILSLCIQTNTNWSTSIMNMSKRLSIIHYSNTNTLTVESKMIHYRHFLLALFIGYQEGYLFGDFIKFDITCVYGLRHTAEMLIIYGLGATISSLLIALVIKRVTLMTSVSFTTLVHSLIFLLLFCIRTQILIHDFPPLILKYILFFSYGIVLGLWSTISIHSICHTTKFSSSSLFAQSLAFRFIGRLIAYSCTARLCQSYLFYINSMSLLCIFSFIFICYCCCHR